MQGQGVSADYQKGYDYSLKAAKLGDGIAIFNIGQFYEQGIVVKKNYPLACAHYSLAKEIHMQTGHDPTMTINYLNRTKTHMTSAQISQAEAKIPELMREYGL